MKIQRNKTASEHAHRMYFQVIRDLSILQQDQEFLTFIMKYQIVGTVVSIYHVAPIKMEKTFIQ